MIYPAILGKWIFILLRSKKTSKKNRVSCQKNPAWWALVPNTN